MRRREEDLQRKRDEKRRLEDEAQGVWRGNFLVCGVGWLVGWLVGCLVGWLVKTG